MTTDNNQPLNSGDFVHYHGSIADYHGNYTVTGTHLAYNSDGSTRYALVGGPFGDTLSNVRRESITLLATPEDRP